MQTAKETATRMPALRPYRRIEGISAVLLPFADDDRANIESFHRLLERTWNAGLTPAVNMDTGYVNLLTPAERSRVLAATCEVAAGRRFVAGAFIEDAAEQPVTAYRRVVADIRRAGGTPILFQCSALSRADERDVLSAYARVAEEGGPLLAFELGSMFAPFGRIYSLDFFKRLLDIEAFTGLKHSSLERELEWHRLEIRDARRPSFALYTGNDLAIDMVFFGSDYLLGLSAFAVEAFALRDKRWAAGDPSAWALNDLLQYLGQLAFRAPVPAYKHSAAQFLKLRGLVATDRTHPKGAQRPESDVALLSDILGRIESEMARGAGDPR